MPASTLSFTLANNLHYSTKSISPAIFSYTDTENILYMDEM